MMQKPEIILTGAGGQLGLTLREIWPQSSLADQLILSPYTSAELDITNPEALAGVLKGKNIAAIINAAAYTAVDAAEQHRDDADRVNSIGPALLASWAAENGSRLIHVSTDFVFAGTKKEPYKESDNTDPLGAYGASKLAGEEAVLASLPESAIVIRTSWLYSPYRNNFVKTMLKLMAERESLSIVNDQIGSPTSTYSLVQLLLRVIGNPGKAGIYHWCDAASISWYDFAVAIQDAAVAEQLLSKKISLSPIPTEQYPTPARRPAYSVLATNKAQQDFSIGSQDWRQNLVQVLSKLKRLSD